MAYAALGYRENKSYSMAIKKDGSGRSTEPDLSIKTLEKQMTEGIRKGRFLIYLTNG